MTIETLGDIVLTSEYWDCECDEKYIHSYTEEKCSVCGTLRVDQPLFRINEVIAMGLPLKSENN